MENKNVSLKYPMIKFISKQKSSDLVGVEIGVWRGEHSFYILNLLPVKKLFLIDPYLEYKEFKGNLGFEGITQKRFDDEFKALQKKLRPFGDKVKLIRKKSTDAVSDVPNNLDFVYIDGNHSYEFVKQDIEMYYPKLRAGGVFGGDNFESLFPDVARAVLEFIDKYNLKLYGGQSDLSFEWWVIKPN